MELWRRWRLLKGTRFCWTRWIRRLRQLTFVLLLILLSAFAGSMLSHPELVTCTGELVAEKKTNQELLGFLNGTLRMMDENTGELFVVVKQKVEVVE